MPQILLSNVSFSGERDSIILNLGNLKRVMAFTWWSLSFLECSSCLIISRPLCPSDTVLPGWRVFLAFHFALFPALDRKATTPPGTLIHLTNRLPGFLGALPIRNSEATVGGRGRCARRRPSFAGSATAGRLVFGGSLRVGPGTQMLSVEDTEELLRPATRDARGVGGTTPLNSVLTEGLLCEQSGRSRNCGRRLAPSKPSQGHQPQSRTNPDPPDVISLETFPQS